MSAARRNIEIKARVDSLQRVRHIAEDLATEYLGVVDQTDTFFRCHNGRLKVREVDGQPAELIAYERPDTASPKGSDYFLVEVANAQSLLGALTSSLGIERVVCKRREIFLFHNVRIHLDEVDGLGTFVELESVVSEEVDELLAKKALDELQSRLGIDDADLLAGAYADM